MNDTVRTIVVVSAGLSQPSSTRLLADRLAAATQRHLGEAGVESRLEVVELRQHAHDLADHLVAGFPSPALQEAIDAVLGADGLIAVGPIFNASYSGLFKLFFDVVERDALAGTPVLVAATGGTARHSLALEHAFRPLFAYLGAAIVPTAVYAASEDWGRAGMPADATLVERIDRAAGELARETARREPATRRDPFAAPDSFATTFESIRGAGSRRGRHDDG